MRRITVTIETDEREDSGSERVRLERILTKVFSTRLEDSSAREEPHREDGPCYCAYCFSGH